LEWIAESFDGHLCNGGTESNLTALMTCLHSRFPNFADEGIFGLKGRPTLYVSGEAHHSFYRAVQACGLGRQSLREIRVGEDLKMDLGHLQACIAEDRARGNIPVMVVGSLGTTNAGVVDPLEGILKMTQNEGLWFHVDAAWGGAALMVPELKDVFLGVRYAQSVTLDLHKWFSVPFSAGVFLCREVGATQKAFGLPRSPYMTKEKEGGTEPFETSLQWTRRFLGLKFFMTLLGTGTEAYAEVLRSQVRLGTQLKGLLIASGWKVWNETPLPVVCFTHPSFDKDGELLSRILRSIQESGDFWITSTQLGENHISVLRAGIPSFSTTESDIRALVDRLNAEVLKKF
ncbi:MAG: hypothetical protein K2X47_04320, partial [Bdellovibrionales bacterium]|nr:hypothetical protein [Bdellovibrionales bacterium]